MAEAKRQHGRFVIVMQHAAAIDRGRRWVRPKPSDFSRRGLSGGSTAEGAPSVDLSDFAMTTRRYIRLRHANCNWCLPLMLRPCEISVGG